MLELNFTDTQHSGVWRQVAVPRAGQGDLVLEQCADAKLYHAVLISKGDDHFTELITPNAV